MVLSLQSGKPEAWKFFWGPPIHLLTHSHPVHHLSPPTSLTSFHGGSLHCPVTTDVHAFIQAAPSILLSAAPPIFLTQPQVQCLSQASPSFQCPVHTDHYHINNQMIYPIPTLGSEVQRADTMADCILMSNTVSTT